MDSRPNQIRGPTSPLLRPVGHKQVAAIDHWLIFLNFADSCLRVYKRVGKFVSGIESVFSLHLSYRIATTVSAGWKAAGDEVLSIAPPQEFPREHWLS